MVDEDDPVGELVRLGNVVGGEDDGAAVVSGLVHLGPEVTPSIDVETHRRLIQNQEIRIGQHRQGEAQPLLLTA